MAHLHIVKSFLFTKPKKNHFITQTYGGLCDRMRPRAASEFTLPYLNYEIDLKVFFIKKNN